MQTTGHPNATASAVTTALAYVLLRVNDHYSWLGLSQQSALLIAGGAITAVLFIGRRGILPMLSSILHGSAKAVVGPAEPPPAPVPAAPPVPPVV
jgi:hypothetical protein